jgi:hypothetical protein
MKIPDWEDILRMQKEKERKRKAALAKLGRNQFKKRQGKYGRP